MAYSQENPYIKNNAQYLTSSGKKPNGHAYINGFSGGYTQSNHVPVNFKYAPTNGIPFQQHVAHQPRPAQSVQVIIPSPRQTQGPRSTKVLSGLVQSPSATSPSLPIDYQLLLLSLAEDYFSAAHGGGAIIALWKRQSDIQAYHKLIATGLGCLEIALKNSNLQPILEAKIRLRYATVLHDETENSMEAEEALSKGITICDRLRDFNLKYNMQHLLARVLYRRNSRAALRYLDGIIRDAEAYQHVAWVYAFRFLRISLSLESSSHQDILSAIHQLRTVSDLSQKYGDKAVLAAAATIEAQVCLRMPCSPEISEQAQRALATARGSQLDPAVSGILQLTAVTHLVDLCWTLRSADPAQIIQKLRTMQATLETVHGDQFSTEAGRLSIPINCVHGSLPTSPTSIIQEAKSDSQNLLFDWLPNEDIYDLGYLLSGVCTAHKNAFDGLKSEQMLKEGIRRLDITLQNVTKTCQSLSQVTSHRSWRKLQKCFMQLHFTFALSARTSWPAASEQLSLLKDTMNEVQSDMIFVELRMIVHYLEGVIQQGTGALEDALDIFSSSLLALPDTHKSPQSQDRLDISILAALNTLLIVRSRSGVSLDTAQLIDRLHPLCTINPNKAILSAYNFVLATVLSDDTIVHNKQCLQNALQAAKACANNQLTCLTLNFMSWKFFRGVVGEQAEKSARASQSLAQKGKDILWMSVSAGLLADTLEIQGKADQAETVRYEGTRFAGALPEAVRGPK